MKALVINGSYHKEGVVSALVESFKKGLLEGNPQANINIINLLDTPIEFCGGCNTCSKDDDKALGRCAINDGMGAVLKEMLAADIIVFASPIYMHSQTALMKRFMERCLPLVKPSGRGPAGRNPARKGKQGLVILSTGAPYPVNVLLGFTNHSANIMSKMQKFCGCEKTGVIKCGGIESSEKARIKFLKEAFNAGLKFSGAVWPVSSQARPLR